jgi:hypothetical protein
MRLVAASLQPSTLDDFIAPSPDHCVPNNLCCLRWRRRAGANFDLDGFNQSHG